MGKINLNSEILRVACIDEEGINYVHAKVVIKIQKKDEEGMQYVLVNHPTRPCLALSDGKLQNNWYVEEDNLGKIEVYVEGILKALYDSLKEFRDKHKN